MSLSCTYLYEYRVVVEGKLGHTSNCEPSYFKDFRVNHRLAKNGANILRTLYQGLWYLPLQITYSLLLKYVPDDIYTAVVLAETTIGKAYTVS